MLPAALDRAVRLPLLAPDQFVPTKWDTAVTKAKFGNHLLRFIAEDFPTNAFTQKFYERLSNTFGHIAHNNKHGFWDEFFQSRATKIDFLTATMSHPCYGDPAWTYSDVEQVIRARLTRSGILAWHQRLLAQENEARDLAEYHRLARKFASEQAGDEPRPTTAGQTLDPLQVQAPMAARGDSPARRRAPVPIEQADLFAGL